MNDSSFASLSPTLLARKGGAKPAMRRQAAMMTSNDETNVAAAHNLEDLGWNDMGDGNDSHHDAEILQLTPEPVNPQTEIEARQNDQKAQAELAEVPAKKPVVLKQQEEIAERIAAKPPMQAPIQEAVQEAAPATIKRKVPRKRRSALERGKRAAFTLRLDAERHFKLRLACTLRNRSAQQIVTDALDQMLGTMPDVNTLAAQARNSE